MNLNASQNTPIREKNEVIKCDTRFISECLNARLMQPFSLEIY